MKTVEGKSNIKATVICDSISEAGVRITTFELEYPRIIHSELMTHRQFSRNAASSRAIPFEKMLQQLDGKPIRFGAANKGMQDKGEDFRGRVLFENDWGDEYQVSTHRAWDLAKSSAIAFAQAFQQAGYHKQVYNRLLEPFQMMKTVVTATEWNNFFWLRDDGAADPTIRELAACMKKAREESVPKLLKAGHYHLPYVFTGEDYLENPVQCYLTQKDAEIRQFLTLEQAIKVSAARCAAVSFRNEDYGLERCLEVYERLVGSEKKHSSALEHIATPLSSRKYTEDILDDVNVESEPATWQDGITHCDKGWNLWSGNFKGWLQHRQLINGHVKEG